MNITEDQEHELPNFYDEPTEQEMAEYIENEKLCAEKGHDWEVENNIGPESGSESFCCKRCGFETETIVYY